jgi:hypothetical protein
MPHQSEIADIRINNIVTGVRLATTLFKELDNLFWTSSLQAISQTSLSLITLLEVRNLIPSFLPIHDAVSESEEK